MRDISFLVQPFQHLPQKLNSAIHDANKNERWTKQKKYITEFYDLNCNIFFFIRSMLLSPCPGSGAGSVCLCLCVCNGCIIVLYICIHILFMTFCIWTTNFYTILYYRNIFAFIVHSFIMHDCVWRWMVYDFVCSMHTNYVVQWWKSLQWTAAICNEPKKEKIFITVANNNLAEK